MVSGMISSDGIIGFGSDASVRGFIIFVKHSSRVRQTQPKFGGARRRTFQAMVGKNLTCTFLQSQDGNVELKRFTDGTA